MIVRYFECTENGHNKFWEITWTGIDPYYITRWGRIGSKGTSKKSDFKNLFETVMARDGLIESKKNKGYIEKTLQKIEEKPNNNDYLEIW